MEKELILSLSKASGDFIVKTSRSGGPGGQNVNRRETKVQITHPASGASGTSQTHRTQEDNKREAFRRLINSKKFKLWLRIEIAKRQNMDPEDYKRQEGPTGNRGEKIRTYNIPRDEVTDHRTGLKIKGIKDILDGKIDPLIGGLLKERKES